MNSSIQLIVAVACSVIASSGFWAFTIKYIDHKDARAQLLIGLAHDRILELGMKYVEREYITQDEYENLHDYLYLPYEKAGGNGSAKRVMDEVDKLHIRNKAV